jgi:hypothetical protein
VRGGLGLSTPQETLHLRSGYEPWRKEPLRYERTTRLQRAAALNCCTHIPHARRTIDCHAINNYKLQLLHSDCAALNCCTHIPNAKRKTIQLLATQTKCKVARAQQSNYKITTTALKQDAQPILIHLCSNSGHYQIPRNIEQ